MSEHPAACYCKRNGAWTTCDNCPNRGASGAAGPPSDDATDKRFSLALNDLEEWARQHMPPGAHRAELYRRVARVVQEHQGDIRAALASAEQRARTQPAADAHPEDYCHRCGGPNVSWAAPSPLWNAVMRGGDINGRDLFNGIVCPLCFAVLAEAAGIASQWRLSAENVNQPLQTITPSGRVWDDNAWLWREPE
jgi:hypothetical protein